MFPVVEFVEQGVLMGVALADPGGTLELALRQDPRRAGAWAGFDPIAVRVPTATDLDAWQARLDAPHAGTVTGQVGRVLVGLHNPDRIEVRLYADTRHIDTQRTQTQREEA
jgi:hypothetical protein